MGIDFDQYKKDMQNLANENGLLGKQMRSAMNAGNSKKYDELCKKYTENIEAQEGYAAEFKANGINCDNSIEQQKVAKRNLNIDMRDKMNENNSHEKASKYANAVKEDEKRAVTEQSKNSSQKMEMYGVSSEQVEKEKIEQAEQRQKYLGNTR